MNKHKFFICIILGLLSWNLNGQDKFSADDYYIEGVRNFLSGNFKKAGTLLDNCLKLDNKHDAAYYYKAMVALNASEVDNTIKFLSKARSLNPENSWYTVTLARLYAMNNEIEMAILLYQELIEKHPNKSTYYYEIIELYGSAGEYSKALEVLDKIELIRGGADLTTADMRYELLLYNSQDQEAKEYIEQYFSENPSSKHAFILGEYAMAEYKDSLANTYYNQALELDPEFAPAHYGLAMISAKKNEFDNYFQHLNEFLKSENLNPMLKIELLNNELLSAEIIRTFKPNVDTLISTLIQAHPADTNTLSFAANYHVVTGDTQKGFDYFRKNIELNEKSFFAHYDYLLQLHRLSMFEEIIEQGHKSAKIFPENESIYEFLAIAYWRCDKVQESIDTYKHILSFLDKDHPMVKYCYSSLGDLYYKLGKSKTSFKYYDMALKIDENFNMVLNNYAYYLSLEGKKLKKALQMSGKTIESEPDNGTYLDTYGWILHLMGDNVQAKKYIKLAMAKGGKSSADVLDHYAEVLFSLGEYDLAFLYWSDAHKLDPTLGIDKKINQKRNALNKQ